MRNYYAYRLERETQNEENELLAGLTDSLRSQLTLFVYKGRCAVFCVLLLCSLQCLELPPVLTATRMVLYRCRCKVVLVYMHVGLSHEVPL